MSLPRPTTEGRPAPPSSCATSRSLLERVRAADAGAWERLVALYAPLAAHWCRRWAVAEQDVGDVLQEVFQAVFAAIGRFRKEGAGDTFRGWLRTVTHNKVRDHWRRRGREPGGVGGSDAQRRLAQLPMPPGPEGDGGAPDAAERGLFFRALELVRGDFEERTWQAFWRTAVEDRAPRDVAAELGMSPGAVRVAKSRVLHRLREELGDLLE
jgi:RNA polymerase sigma-70 factor, ECF subfamily